MNKHTKKKEDQILKVLLMVRRGKYDRSVISDADSFKKTVAKDIDVRNPEDAAAIVGYCFSKNFINVNPDMGIILTPTGRKLNQQIDEFEQKQEMC